MYWLVCVFLMRAICWSWGMRVGVVVHMRIHDASTDSSLRDGLYFQAYLTSPRGEFSCKERHVITAYVERSNTLLLEGVGKGMRSNSRTISILHMPNNFNWFFLAYQKIDTLYIYNAPCVGALPQFYTLYSRERVCWILSGKTQRKPIPRLCADLTKKFFFSKMYLP